jgi:hypothetical protein
VLGADPRKVTAAFFGLLVVSLAVPEYGAYPLSSLIDLFLSLCWGIRRRRDIRTSPVLRKCLRWAWQTTRLVSSFPSAFLTSLLIRKFLVSAGVKFRGIEPCHVETDRKNRPEWLAAETLNSARFRWTGVQSIVGLACCRV